MPNVKNNAAAQETRRKLMAAAGQIFAAKGVDAATIRQITEDAGVNMAAINYHFRDKYELYDAVIQECHDQAFGKLLHLRLPQGTPEVRLRYFVEMILRHLLVPTRPPWVSDLLARELAHPASSLGDLIPNDVQRVGQQVMALIKELVGEDASEEMVAAACGCVIGQCFYYLEHRPFIEHLRPHLRPYDDIPALAERITQLSIHGLQGIATPAAQAAERTV